jgi:hypothetical protein
MNHYDAQLPNDNLTRLEQVTKLEQYHIIYMSYRKCVWLLVYFTNQQGSGSTEWFSYAAREGLG